MRLSKLLLTMLIAIFVVTNAYANQINSLTQLRATYRNDPRGLSKWMKDNVKYTKDRLKLDEWQTPKRTLLRREGDCEDYAILANYVLGKGKFLAVSERGKKGHAVLIFKHDGKYYMYSNHKLRYLGRSYLGYNKIASIVNSKWTKWVITNSRGCAIKRGFRNVPN